MQTYLRVIEIGLVFVPFVVILVSIPFLIGSYHKFGRVTIKRWLIVMSFFIYLFMVLCFAVLPLPTIEEVAAMTGKYVQLQPFYFLRLFFLKSGFVWNELSTYLSAIKTSYFWVPLFNVIFFVPLGVYLRYYFKQPFWKTLLFSILLTLFIELTQLSGLYGIYPRPYRLFDVDDLLMNTLGGVVGYIIAPLLTWWLPTKDEILDQSYELGETVSFIRRSVAVIIDWATLALLTGLAFVLYASLANITEPSVPTHYWYIAYILIVFIYFILLPYFWKGRTFGKWLVQIAIINDEFYHVTFGQLFLRQILFYGLCFPSFIIFIWLGQQDLMIAIQNPLILFALILTGIITLGFVANIFYVRNSDNPSLFYERLTHTLEVSTIINPED